MGGLMVVGFIALASGRVPPVFVVLVSTCSDQNGPVKWLARRTGRFPQLADPRSSV